VLIGDQCLWIEQGQHWAIADFIWQDVFNLVGRKDSVKFGPNLPDWIEGGWHAPKNYAIPDRPVFMNTDENIALWQGSWDQLDVMSIAKKTLLRAPALSV
jgi:hypothetical protein